MILGLAVVLGAAACGGASAEEAIAALTSAILAGEDSESITAEQADCIATTAVDDLGAGFVTGHGLLGADVDVDNIAFDPDAADVLAAATFDCLDAGTTLIDELAEANLAPGSYRNCMGTITDYDLMREGISAELQGRDDEADRIGDVFLDDTQAKSRDCMIAGITNDVVEDLLNGFRSDGADEEFLACFERRVDLEPLREALGHDIDGDDDAALALQPQVDQAFGDAIARCQPTDDA